MKTLIFTSFRRYPRWLALALLGTMSFISSCSKDDDQNEIAATSAVMIVNTSQGSVAQDFYIDDAKVSQGLSYSQATGYGLVYSGARKLDFKSTGSATVTATSSFNFGAGRYYTVYYNGGETNTAMVITEDPRTTPSSGKAAVRFVHLYSGATNDVDLTISGGTRIVSGLAYRSASAFTDVDPAVSFQLSANGSNTVLLTLASLNLQTGKSYTIVISGSSALTLNYGVIANN